MEFRSGEYGREPRSRDHDCEPQASRRMKPRIMAAVAGLALALSWAPLVAVDLVSTALIVGAASNLTATMLDSGLPALQADRRRDEYLFQTVEHLQRGQIAIREGQIELARMLNELGDRVPKEVRAELDELIENQVTGVAHLMISDMEQVKNGGTPVIAPGERLETLQTHIATYMQRPSGHMGLGVAGWSLTVELAFLEANREAFMTERGLHSMEDSYRTRVRNYFDYFVHAFSPERPDSVRTRLDRERRDLDKHLESLKTLRQRLEAAISGLPNLPDLDSAIRNYRRIRSIGIPCYGPEGVAIPKFSSPSYWNTLEAYVSNDSMISQMRGAINPIIHSVRHHASMVQHLADELMRASRLFQGLMSIRLHSGRMHGRTIGVGVDHQMTESLEPSTTLSQETITLTLESTLAAQENARNAQESLGIDRRRRAQEHLNKGKGSTHYYCMETGGPIP